MIAVGLLLLIACVNLAGLLVARNASRQHELGMRLARGKPRPHPPPAADGERTPRGDGSGARAADGDQRQQSAARADAALFRTRLRDSQTRRVYGLLAHLVARRVPEIGVRLALGARPGQMLWMMLRENLVLAAAGSIIGIACAAVSLGVLEGVLFGLSPTDGVNLASAALILVVVSLAAALVPARRAASVDPLVALRVE